MSLYPWFNDIPHPLVEQPEKFARRKGGLRGPRVWSIQELDSKALAEGLKANSTLTNLTLAFNAIFDEGAKAWCLVEDGVTEGKASWGFHRKDQDIQVATWKWSQWNAQRTWKQCTVCLIFADLKWEAGSLEYIVLQCFPGWGTPKSRYIMIWYIGPQMCYMRTSVHLLTLGHTLNQSCLSNVESRSFTIEHNSFRDRRCVLLLLVAEHFLKGQMHGDSDSSLVVLWWSDCLGFRLDWCSGKSTCLSGALFEQVRANLYSVTKKLNCIPKRAVYVSLSVIQWYPSSLGWTAGEICKKEGRTERTQSLINSRAGLEGLGRRPQSELYFDEFDFGVERDFCWRGKGLVFGWGCWQKRA